MHGRFILKNNGDHFLFQLRAAQSSELLLSSERYARKSHALEAIAAVQASASRSRFRRGRSLQGEAYFFELFTKQGEVIATSEPYSSERACDAGIAAVRASAPHAVIEDQTDYDPADCTHPSTITLT